MILVDCNSPEYLDEIGYISPTEILDMIPLIYGMEIIKCNAASKDSLNSALRVTIKERQRLSRMLHGFVHSYEKLNNLNKTIVFYMPSNDNDQNEFKDIIFCVVCSLKYTKQQLLKLMKRYVKLRAFL